MPEFSYSFDPFNQMGWQAKWAAQAEENRWAAYRAQVNEAKRVFEETYRRVTGKKHPYHRGTYDVPSYQRATEELLEEEQRLAVLRPKLKAQAERREALHKPLLNEFAMAGGRNMWIWHQRQLSPCPTFQEIGDRLGITRHRVRQIYFNIEWRRRRRAGIAPFEYPRDNLGKVIDMGGPRGEWLTYYPPIDPRIEPNIELIDAV